jgi:hypothetical protein
MWASHLSRQPDLFSAERPVMFGTLETVTVDRGIDDRWWGPAPAGAIPASAEEVGLPPRTNVDRQLTGWEHQAMLSRW